MQKHYWSLFRIGLSFWILIFSSLIGLAGPVNITSWQMDLQHTGLNNQETVLTPSQVSAPGNFGLLFSQQLDGQSYGQPLYVAGLKIGGTIHNVIFVATEHCSVYAFDADNAIGANAAPLWHVSLLPAGTVPVPQPDVLASDILVEVGITTTPVIDATSNTLYIATKIKTTANTTYQQYLHALDITTGVEKFNGPTLINPTFAGRGEGEAVNGVIPFNPLREHMRAAMVLYNGVVYLTYASHGDVDPYHGEIIGYSASDLQLVKTFITTPNGPDGGLWGAGAGPAIDPATGNMFISTGNGVFDSTGSPYSGDADWSESFVKLPTSGTFDLSYANTLNWFTPNIFNALNNADLDLGSSGVLLLPDQLGGTHPHLMVGGGKGGVLYVVDRDNMGGLHTPDTAVQEINEPSGVALFCTPAYYNGNIYYAGDGEPLVQRAVGYNPTTGNYISNTAITSSYVFNGKGASCFISANNNSNGIVWTLAVGSPVQLMAYDATNISKAPLVNSSVILPGNNYIAGIKFSHPIVTNGRVYFTGYNNNPVNTGYLLVYGILPTTGGIPAAPGNVTTTAISSSQVTVTWTNNASNASGFIVSRSTTPGGPFTAVGTVGAASTSYTDSGLAAPITYYYNVMAINSIGNSSSSNVGSTTTFPYYTPTGLVAYLPLDEGTGSIAGDTTGHGNNGTLNGEVVWIQGQINQAVSFHGTGYAVSNVDVPDSASFQFSAKQSFCLSAWVNPGQLRGNYMAVVTKGYNAGVGNYYGIWINPSHQFVFRGPNGDLVGPAATAGVWQHVAVVQDAVAGTRSIYLNGVLGGTGAVQPADAIGDLLIGMASGVVTPSPAQGFPGIIDEVRVYNRALAAGEISTLLSPPVLEAVSDQVQGAAGTFGLIVSPSSTRVIESREGSTPGSYTLALNFSAPVSGLTATLGLTNGGSALGQIKSLTYDATGRVVTVNLAAIGNAQILNIHLAGIQPGNGTADIPFNVLWGDVNQDGVVNNLDQALITNSQSQAVTPQNALFDLNSDGQISAQDSALVTNAIGTQLGVQAPPAITSALSASEIVGTPFSYQITASSNPTSFMATGLPAGLSLNTATGLITGTSAAPGQYPVTLSASNAAGSGASSVLALVVSNQGVGSATLTLVNAVTAGSNVINLTADGTLDWAEWGLTDPTPNRLNGTVISNYSVITPGSSVYRYTNNLTPFTWSNGQPTATATATTTGIYTIGVNNGFQVVLASDPTPRLANIYVGGWLSSAQLTARFADGSAGPLTSAIASGNGQYFQVYTIRYSSSTSSPLTLQWTQTGGLGNVTLNAVSLSSPDLAQLTNVATATNVPVNLTTLGTFDWREWGLNPALSNYGIGTAVSDYSIVAAGSPVYAYYNNLTPFAWSNGHPIANSAGTASGVYTSGIANGFQVTLNTSPTLHTATFYVGGWSSSAQLTGSFANGVANIVSSPAVSGTGQYFMVYTLTYSSTTSTPLTLKWAQTGGTGNVTLNAVAIQ